MMSLMSVTDTLRLKVEPFSAARSLKGESIISREAKASRYKGQSNQKKGGNNEDKEVDPDNHALEMLSTASTGAEIIAALQQLGNFGPKTVRKSLVTAAKARREALPATVWTHEVARAFGKALRHVASRGLPPPPLPVLQYYRSIMQGLDKPFAYGPECPVRAKNAHKINVDRTLKIVMVGDSTVGKTSMLHRFTERRQALAENVLNTIGIDFKHVVVRRTEGGANVRLQIWDTAGQERFRQISTAYYRGAHGFVLMFDVSDNESLAHLVQRVQEIRRVNDSPMVLVGNKADVRGPQNAFERELSRRSRKGSGAGAGAGAGADAGAGAGAAKDDVHWFSCLKPEVRKVTTEEATAFAAMHGMVGYFEVSCTDPITETAQGHEAETDGAADATHYPFAALTDAICDAQDAKNGGGAGGAGGAGRPFQLNGQQAPVKKGGACSVM